VSALAALKRQETTLNQVGDIMRLTAIVVAVIASVLSVSARADVTVTQFDPSYVANGQWYLSDMRFGGTATLVDLTGEGGDLESNQPLPIGAALLTTTLGDNADKAEVGVADDYGLASAVLNAVELAYSYYKETVGGGNAFAAPSLKLTVYTAGGAGDNYGQLVYEPTWNQPGGGSQASPADAWQHLTITPATGGGDGDGSGGWWWSGGFEVPSGAGGPPLRSLAEWATTFAAADPTDFANARVVQVSVGVGTYNLGQIGYFDRVSITGTSADCTYDFEPMVSVPVEKTTWTSIKAEYR
jgi:hypothetical protein